MTVSNGVQPTPPPPFSHGPQSDTSRSGATDCVKVRRRRHMTTTTIVSIHFFSSRSLSAAAAAPKTPAAAFGNGPSDLSAKGRPTWAVPHTVGKFVASRSRWSSPPRRHLERRAGKGRTKSQVSAPLNFRRVHFLKRKKEKKIFFSWGPRQCCCL